MAQQVKLEDDEWEAVRTAIFTELSVEDEDTDALDRAARKFGLDPDEVREAVDDKA